MATDTTTGKRGCFPVWLLRLAFWSCAEVVAGWFETWAHEREKKQRTARDA